MYLYFDNDIPNFGDINYETTYNSYIGNKPTYETKKLTVHLNGETTQYPASAVIPFFNTVTENYEKVKSFIGEVFTFLSDNPDNKLSLQLGGSASAPANVTYNVGLSQRRIDSVKKFLLEYQINGKSLKNFGKDGTGQLTFINDSPAGENGQSFPVVNGVKNTVECTKDIIDVTVTNNQPTTNSQIYSVPAMACRNVLFKQIVPSQGKPKPTPTPPPTPPPPQTTPQPIPPSTVPTVDFKTEIIKGASKKVLRALFSECDYFEVIKETNPMVYNTFREKIKYFNPAFHSMTPEGLNSRLTFLNQCLRPGDTIPVIGPDGNPKNNDALNTSFGTPPVLILRVGDFYNTKIIPDNVQFSYDPIVFDMNPEGIGVQPMIVNVQMSFKIIGGMGLKEPVEQLQNALSFNYYANTEIYDERSTYTDTSFEKFDTEIVDSIRQKQQNEKTTVPEQPKTNGGGTTIGKIGTSVVSSGGTSGTLDYTEVMNNLEKEVKNYLKNIINQSETIVKNYNLGVLSLTNFKRNYTEGSFIIHDSVENTEQGSNLYGKSDSYEERLNSLFDQVVTDVENDNNPIVMFMINTGKYKENTIRDLKNNMINYIKTIKSNFTLKLTTTIQDISTQEQNLISLISKINLELPLNFHFVFSQLFLLGSSFNMISYPIIKII